MQRTLELQSVRTLLGKTMLAVLQPKLQEPLVSSGVTSTAATEMSEKRHINLWYCQPFEYTASVWDPHTSADINMLGHVQRRGARFTMNKYWEKTPDCVTKTVHDLGWQTLEERRRRLRLTMLFKFQHGLTDAVPCHKPPK